MPQFSRKELETTFLRFRDTLDNAMASRDWRAWADFYTEDALYVEHAMGTFHGRQEIYEWIINTMSEESLQHIEAFPVDWYVICEERGWIIAQFGTRMRDPGDGEDHYTYCFSLLKYAGNGQWHYEEDIYNPSSMQAMLANWQAASMRHSAPH